MKGKKETNIRKNNRSLELLPLATHVPHNNDNFNNKLDVLLTASPLNPSPHCPSVSTAYRLLHYCIVLRTVYVVHTHVHITLRLGHKPIQVDTCNKISCTLTIACRVVLEFLVLILIQVCTIITYLYKLYYYIHAKYHNIIKRISG